MTRTLHMVSISRAARVLLAAVVSIHAGVACHRSDPAVSGATAALPSCDAVGRMNLIALADIPELKSVTSEWLQGRSSELAAVFPDGLERLGEMQVAHLCQTARRAPSGGRELAVTLTGSSVPALFAHLATAAPTGLPPRAERWGTADVLVGDRRWVALHEGSLVFATTEDVLRRVLSGPVEDAAGDPHALLSLTLTGDSLQDILGGGQPFRVAALNAVRALHIEVGPDGTSLSARLSTADPPAAAALLGPLQTFLEQLRGAMMHRGSAPAVELSARGADADVVVSAKFSSELREQLVQRLAKRVAKSRAHARTAGPR
ncbi:MAG: hypothetical protein ACREBE_00400 [bacterium]